MAIPLGKYVVFDHASDSGVLEARAGKCGFSKLKVTKVGDAKEEQAKDILLGDNNWRIALVHLDDEPWKALLRGVALNSVPEDRALIRFSTEGFAPALPEESSILCLRCIKRIDEIREEDLRALRRVLADRDLFRNVRNGVIPLSIRHLFAFRKPDIIVALHILMAGVLSSWASDSGHAHSESAREILGRSSFARVPSSAIDMPSTIKQSLGLEGNGELRSEQEGSVRRTIAAELGIRNLEDLPEIGDLFNAVCQVSENAELDAIAVVKGFNMLEQLLQRTTAKKTWQRSRSDFNHAWLKNRLIVTLSRAKKVMEGVVLDESIDDDLANLFGEWPSRKNEAERVLDGYLGVWSPTGSSESVTERINDSEVEDQRRAAGADVDARKKSLFKAREALRLLDSHIIIVSGLLRSFRVNTGFGDHMALIELQIAASNAGSAFAALDDSGI